MDIRMITKNVLWALLLFFIQPVFLAGLFYSSWSRNKRLKYVRKNYRLNFNRLPFEVLDYLFKAFFIGGLISLVSVGIGVPLTLEWYIMYQLITIVLLMISGSRFVHPLFTFSLSSLALFLVDRAELSLPFGFLKQFSEQSLINVDFQLTNLSSLMLNSLFFVTVILLLTSFLIKNKNENKYYPKLASSKRGKAVAKYTNRSLWVLPLFAIVPGNVIEPFASWWPLFSIGGEKYAILLLPILIGIHYTVSTQLLEEASEKMVQDFHTLGSISALLLIGSYFYNDLSVFALAFLLVGGLVVYYRHRKRENLWTFKYGPADEGIRVIAVRPNSPAERMNLSVGAIITHINDEEIRSKDEFYETMTYNRSYVKMRLKRTDGEVVIVETPLYEDDFNNLGVLIL